MKKKLNRPWLTSSDVEIPTEKLKEITKSWDQKIWEDYLDWYQSSCQEKIIDPVALTTIGDECEESIFEEFGYDSNYEDQNFCDFLLSNLNPLEAATLRKCILEGKTERQVAFELNRSSGSISQNKHKAIVKLKTAFNGDELSARHIMRGQGFDSTTKSNKSWETVELGTLKENRRYRAGDFDFELKNHPIFEIREFFRNSSSLSRKCVYLRFWCDLSVNEIARKCSIGVNTVETIISSTVFKLKSVLISNYNNAPSMANAA